MFRFDGVSLIWCAWVFVVLFICVALRVLVWFANFYVGFVCLVC